MPKAKPIVPRTPKTDLPPDNIGKKKDLVPEQPIRAFEIIDRVQPGQTLWQMKDGYHHPHLRAGEFAVVDLNDRRFQNGELYLVQWGKGKGASGVYQVTKRTLMGKKQVPFEGIFFGPLYKPKRLPNGDWDPKQPMFLTEGPLKAEYLDEYLLGRVVGILAGTTAPDRQPTAPKIEGYPRPNPEDELKWRYLAWLHYEKQQLSDQLGAKGWTVEDRQVSLFLQSYFRGDPNRETAADRAERILMAAGLTTKPDPHWAGHYL